MNDARSEVQILEYLSECLRLFRKRLMQMIKISQQSCSSTISQQFQITTQQSIKLLAQFDKIVLHFFKSDTVFARFSSRVKEIVSNMQLKSTSSDITNYLSFLSTLLKDSIDNKKMNFILKHMLQKSPNDLIKPLTQPDQVQKNYVISEQNTPIKLRCSLSTGYNTQKIERNVENHQKFSQVLENQFKLYTNLSLDQGEYRKNFLLARQDHHRKDNNLYEDMIFRNRFTQEMLNNYRNQFEKYCKKLQVKKNRNRDGSRKNGKIIRPELTNFNVQQPLLRPNKSQKVIETSMNANSFQSRKKRMKTDNYDKSGIFSKQVFGNQLKEDGSIFPKKKRLRTQFHTCLSTDQFCINEKFIQLEKPRPYARNGGNLIQLKKINFLGSRIQLVPESKQQKDNIKIDRKKNLCKRTQQHLKRKISIISQTKTNSNSYLNAVTPGKPKSFTPLLIDYSKLIK